MKALSEAIERAGSATALAKHLGIASNTPSMWRARGLVPSDYCPGIEGLTGVRCEELRPDIPWHVLRGKPAPRKRKARAK